MCKKGLSICDEKTNCSGHGKCVEIKCVCDDGFKSEATADTVFCNKCEIDNWHYPYCVSEKEGVSTTGFDFDSPCSAYGPSLPTRLSIEKDSDDGDEKSIGNEDGVLYKQFTDGSIELNAIFKFTEEEELLEFFVPEDSIIRVFYQSRETNRSKVMLLSSTDEESKPLAYTSGTNPNESFIAKLEKRDSPYFLKIFHNNYRTSCNRYLLRISSSPLIEVIDYLKCNDKVNTQDPSKSLPLQSYLSNKEKNT